MPRRLNAIEIAEGALLADIAIVFQLLVQFLPIIGVYFALLIPALFTILVLRRSFYTGIMGLCVALFIVGVLTGLASVQPMLLECGAGIFLGVTMKYRLHYFPLILLGATGSAIGFFVLTLLNILLLGKPFVDILLLGFRNVYNALFALMNSITPQIGLSTWWYNIYPAARHLADLTLTYWLILMFISHLIILIPVVAIVYYITAFVVRLLGYNVRPFPDGRINKILQWFIRLSIKGMLRLGLGRSWLVRQLIKEFRRQSMGLRRQKTTP
ncbi:MAG: hypothetical protein NVSMB33_03000 [Ktedonobacteraceae bacterium]